jgi:mitochondrial import receptor subunit TOM70
VLPLVNKGLALFQFKQDIGAAEQCCQEALRIDSESDAAVATLAQLCLQQGKIDLAIEMLDRQAELARTEPELVGALTFKYVGFLFIIKFAFTQTVSFFSSSGRGEPNRVYQKLS